MLEALSAKGTPLTHHPLAGLCPPRDQLLSALGHRLPRRVQPRLRNLKPETKIRRQVRQKRVAAMRIDGY